MSASALAISPSRHRARALPVRTGLELSVQEMFTVVVLIFYGTAAYIPILMPNAGGAVKDTAGVSQVHGVNHITLAVAWTIISLLVFKSWKALRFHSRPAQFLLAYSFWGVISTLWSGFPGAALSGGLSAVFSTFFSLYLVGRFNRRRLMVMLTWVFMALALGSALLAILAPVYGVDHFSHEGAWQGLFTQKNGLGNVMVYGIAVALAFSAHNLMERVWKGILFFSSAVALFMSQSREAWVVAVVAVLIYLSVHLIARFAFSDRDLLLALCAGGTFVLSALAIIFGPALLQAMGRDITLTGRTDIWGAVIKQLPGHWILGYGLMSFWGSGESSRIQAILHWTPSSAHNGYLESLLQLGLVGLGLTVLTLLFAWRDAWYSLKTRGASQSILPYTMLVILPILNMVAYLIPYPNSINWALLMMSAALVEQDAKAYRRTKQAAGLAKAG